MFSLDFGLIGFWFDFGPSFGHFGFLWGFKQYLADVYVRDRAIFIFDEFIVEDLRTAFPFSCKNRM